MQLIHEYKFHDIIFDYEMVEEKIRSFIETVTNFSLIIDVQK